MQAVFSLAAGKSHLNNLDNEANAHKKVTSGHGQGRAKAQEEQCLGVKTPFKNHLHLLFLFSVLLLILTNHPSEEEAETEVAADLQIEENDVVLGFG